MEPEKDMEVNQNQKRKKGKTIRNIILAILILILLLLVKCSTDFYISDTVNDTNTNIVEGVIDIQDDKKDEIQNNINTKVEAGMFQIFINTDITVDKNDQANVLIQNTVENNYPVEVEIFHGKSRIYKSGIINPGYKIETDKITGLEEGEYECKAYFNILSKDLDKINSVGVNIKIEKRG